MTATAEDAPTREPLRVSVVVCTYNRAQQLATCLTQLGDQSLERSSYEIIVFDDCSTDETASVVARFHVRPIRSERNVGPSVGRNLGAKAATAPIIAFTDDDCVPDREWLEQLLVAFSGPDVLGVGGKIEPLRTDRLLLRYYEACNPFAHNPHPATADGGLRERFDAYLQSSFRLRSLPDDQESLFAIAAGNMAIRRSAFELLGGFNEHFAAGGEEDDLCMRLHKLRPDAKLRYSPKAIVLHDYDASLRDALRRNRRYGRAAAISYLQGGGRLPAIFPFPILILLSFALAAINLAFLAVPVVLLVLLYPGWLRLAVMRRKPAYVCFAGLQAAFEVETTVGFLSHLAAERRIRPRRSALTT
jgi:GT2 family glycosyltransferase